MYNQISPIPIRSSASLLCNNLDILNTDDETNVSCNIVHKSVVWIFNSESACENDLSTYKRVVCKGESSHASALIIQAKWCVLPQRTVLVVTSLKGAQIFEPDGSIMIFWQSLASSPDEDRAQFARGITAVGQSNICVGVADGSILVFDIPAKGSAVKLQETLSSHSCSITDLHSFQDNMVSADEDGKIIVWQATGHFQKLREINGHGSPCSSIRIWKSFIVGGYGSGHLRVFNCNTGVIITEIAAHARWINAIDIAEACGLLVSTSEDSFVRVWNLYNFELLYQQSVDDVQITGVRFFDPNGTSFGITGYDCSDVIRFQKT